MVNLKVTGIEKAKKAMDDKVKKFRAGGELKAAMRTATLLIERDAKKGAPVDTGKLVSSITSEIRVIGKRLVGIVGSSLSYAPFVELGTKAHFPPLWAIAGWARRHKRSAWDVATKISHKGTPAFKYLAKASRKNRSKVVSILEAAVKRIVA